MLGTHSHSFAPAVLAATLVLSSCATAGTGDLPPAEAGTLPRVAVEYDPVTGDLVLESDRPMNAAVFAVTERGLPRLLYPTRRHRTARVTPDEPLRVDQRYTSGLPRAQVGYGAAGPDRPEFRVDPAGDLPRVAPSGHRTEAVWVYVVASTERLRTDSLVGRSITPVHRSFYQRAIEPKLDALASRVLAVGSESEQWTERVLVLWR